MKNKLIQIAIDGPAGSGKSTVSKALADHYNIFYLSSGKIFRSYAYALKNINPRDEQLVKKELEKVDLTFKDGHFFVNKKDITNELTSDIYSLPASIISAYPFTREKYLVDIKKIIKTNSIVIDGRDIGTVVMPETKYKFYLDASAEIRAYRRSLEIDPNDKIGSKLYNKILAEIKQRDYQDKNRATAPLVQAPDAYYVDSNNLNVAQVVDYMVKIIDKIRG